jgi:hypothetical protein
MNTVGEPYSGKPNVRFDEGRLARLSGPDQSPTLPVPGWGPYQGSAEELTPLAGDPLAAVPVLAAAAACLLQPRWQRLFTTSAVSGYALTPYGWQALLHAELS